MRGHTPGPWRLTNESPKIIQRDYRAIGSDGGPLIASVMGNDNSGFYVAEDEALANARLIAIAPELLEIAQALVRAVNEGLIVNSSDDDSCGVPLDFAGAALTKAGSAS